MGFHLLSTIVERTDDDVRNADSAACPVGAIPFPEPAAAPSSEGHPVTSESVEIPAISVRAANGGPLKKSKPGAGRSELGMALLFIAPATIGFLIFYLYPTIRGFYFSLTRYNLLGQPHFIGFGNFVKIANDK